MHELTRRETLALLAGACAIGSVPVDYAYADDTLDRVRRTGKLRLGFFNQAPWGFLNADGTMSGQGPDVVGAAMAPLGIKDIEPVAVEFSAMIPGLLAGRFDAVAGGLYVNKARCQQVIFGNPDIQMGDALLVKAGNPMKLNSYDDIANNKDALAGTLRGSVLVQNLEKAGVPRDRIVLFPDNAAMIAGLQTGRVQGVLGTAASMVRLLTITNDPGVTRAEPFTGLKGPDGAIVLGYPAAAFRPGDTALRDAYNAQLAILRGSGALKTILGKYGFGETEMPPETMTAVKLCAA